MKQTILNLKKKLLLVELPEGYVVVSVFPSKRTLTMWNGNGQYITEKLDFDVDEIGKLTDITESQYQQWVDKFNNGAYRNYKDEYPFYPDFDTDNFFLTAKESFFSYLEKEGIYFENKLEKPKKKEYELNPSNEKQRAMIIEDKKGLKPTWQSIFYKSYRQKLNGWQEAEEKVWKIENTYLFEIL